MRWLIDRWRERQRAIDLEILWPVCRDEAPDLDTARAAFAMHAYRDPAWMGLGAEEIRRRINELE
jgi:hypothetical protein